MDPLCQHQACMARRQFFGKSALGIGGAALASLEICAALGALARRPEAATLPA
mgnify:CR=1 FL=1